MLALLSCKKSEGKCGFGAQINVCSYSYRVVNLLNLFRRIEQYFLQSPSFSLSKQTIEMLVKVRRPSVSVLQKFYYSLYKCRNRIENEKKWGTEMEVNFMLFTFILCSTFFHLFLFILRKKNEMKVKQKILSFYQCATIMSHHYGHVSKKGTWRRIRHWWNKLTQV